MELSKMYRYDRITSVADQGTQEKSTETQVKGEG